MNLCPTKQQNEGIQFISLAAPYDWTQSLTASIANSASKRQCEIRNFRNVCMHFTSDFSLIKNDEIERSWANRKGCGKYYAQYQINVECVCVSVCVSRWNSNQMQLFTMATALEIDRLCFIELKTSSRFCIRQLHSLLFKFTYLTHWCTKWKCGAVVLPVSGTIQPFQCDKRENEYIINSYCWQMKEQKDVSHVPYAFIFCRSNKKPQ